jgi:peptidoglycan hydrolase-like protein with peptidoglycan-binding domain
MNDIFIRQLAKKYFNNPTEEEILGLIKKMEDPEYQDFFYNEWLKNDYDRSVYDNELKVTWYKSVPCILNITNLIENTHSEYVFYKSTTKDVGGVYLYKDGKFYTENGTKFPNGGVWSCTATGKIFLDYPKNSQTTSTTTTTKPKFEWQEVSIIPQDVAQGNKLVKLGMKGDIVSTIQQYLIDNGFPNISKTGKPDGKFGKRTYNSVIDFQKSKGLEKVEGIVGQETWAALTKPKDTDTDTNTTNNNEIPDMNKLTVSPDYNPEFRKENHMKKLNNIIKENLIQTKENKKKTLQESKIVKTRMDFIVETNKTNLDSALLSVLFEMFYLDNQGFNGKIIQENVESVFGALGNIFGNKHNEVSERFKEIGVRHILGKLDVSSDTGLGDFLMVALSNTDIKDVPKLFSDCDYLTNKIANAIPEAYLNQLKYDEGMGSEFMEKVKSSLADVIKESDFSDKIKDRIKGIICPLVDNMQEKFGNHLSSMKSKLTSSTQA